MIFEIKEQNEKVVATVSGRLDTPASVKAQKEIEPILQNADKPITLDCSDLEYISSSGLRMFLTIRKEAAAKGSKVTIKNINDDIKKVFMMTGFYNLFQIVND
jgi:anti-sigma B factor antagonist